MDLFTNLLSGLKSLVQNIEEQAKTVLESDLKSAESQAVQTAITATPVLATAAESATEHALPPIVNSLAVDLEKTIFQRLEQVEARIAALESK